MGMITYRILDIFCLTVLGTGWTCCIFMIALKYELFARIENLLIKWSWKGQVCYFCVGFWVCLVTLSLIELIGGSHQYVISLLSSLSAAPFIRMLMIRYH